MRKIAIAFVRFYQKFISPITVGSCRYYPSCSEYAIWQFETNGFLRALFASLLRILRCNKLFPGGIEYPKIAFQKPKITPKAPIRYNEFKYFIAPEKNHFVVIKVLKK
ncbi:MAG: membrane protein insertion efficiency factor YidD [Campylobacteraceae bacterium]|jgi:putative membrane protein insertion efficiency factor|nr:membrane protein insertion efficiency factor YidD [Campylobacteraceae bacterium]